MGKTIGIIGRKDKKISLDILSRVFKNKAYLVKVLSYDDKGFDHINMDVLIDLDINLAKEEKYLEDKMKLISSLKKDTLLIINADDSQGVRLASVSDQPIVMTYGLSGKNSLTISSLDFNHRTNFNLCLQRRLKTARNIEILQFEHPIEMNLINMDQLYGVIATISACIYFDIDIEKIERTLAEIKV